MKFLLLCSTRHLISEDIFQVHGENWPVANPFVVQFRSQPGCSIRRKEGEKENEESYSTFVIFILLKP